MEKQALPKRLESLDALRGFDLFFLVALGPLLRSIIRAADVPWLNSCQWLLLHQNWTGFSPWDLIMPLFLFMSGITIPFAYSRYKKDPDKKPLVRRLVKRVLLLWLFGMIVQGNLRALDPDHIYFYTNTLQSIAVGYLFSVLFYLYTSKRTQIVASFALLMVYWAAMQFIKVGSFGGGDYTPDGNLCEWIDRTVLGRFRDGAEVQNGTVVFAEGYYYTWILSSLNFVATVMSGMFAGYIAKSRELTDKRKVQLFLGIGAVLVAVGWTWNLVLPVIKTIWTSSMVFVSSGYCFLLMGLFYYWIDYKGHRKHLTWLKVYGLNSIVAYMLAETVRFSSIGESLLYGFEQYLGSFYSPLIVLSNAAVVFFILWVMYKQRIFLKV